MAIATGAHPGRYEVCSQFGAGGMGEVYLARDTQLDRTISDLLVDLKALKQ
jgi:serine/threonine protein kinase